MIRKIKEIGNFAVFKNFKWNDSVVESNGQVKYFKNINILYGRNYSGKTSLSRIFRAFETCSISEKFENPNFTLELNDGKELKQDNLTIPNQKVRVFNEDFIRDNLRFITNPDDSIEPFAILGEDNNKLEKEIKEIEKELNN